MRSNNGNYYRNRLLPIFEKLLASDSGNMKETLVNHALPLDDLYRQLCTEYQFVRSIDLNSFEQFLESAYHRRARLKTVPIVAL